MSAPSLAVLCINLAAATQRWQNVEALVRRHLPGYPMTRIDAVNWQDFSDDMAEIPLSPLSRLFVQRPGSQAALRASHRQMDSRSSVAIMLAGARLPPPPLRAPRIRATSGAGTG
jgi:hypothetical protein